MSTFKYLDYKDLLRQKIEDHSSTHGYKSKLSEVAGCQKSFLSRVLNSDVHLAAEHAEKISNFWNLTPLEKNYFIALVQLARSGTSGLKNFWKDQLQEIKNSSENLEKRYANQTQKPSKSLETYYSRWEYGLVHMLTTIPRYRTEAAMTKKLGINKITLKTILSDLEKMGLAEKKSSEWHASKKRIHLPKRSPLNTLNHSNWRNLAIQNTLKTDPLDIHYSAGYSMSKSSYNQLRQILLEFIDQSREIVHDSEEEEVVIFNCDLFQLGPEYSPT